MNVPDADYFEAHPHLPYRFREWEDGDPAPFITSDAYSDLFAGYVLTTVIRRDGEARVVWVDRLLHNRGVIRTEQIIDVLMTRQEKWRWTSGMGMLKPTLIPL